MKKGLKYILIILIPLWIFSCAKQGSPTGGAKDNEKPGIVDYNPENETTNFSSDEFEIEFDEYIKLNNIQKNLIVSPPFSEKPEVKIKGKGIKVELPEKPKDSTTYSFTFLNAISDITEGNKIPNLVYAFATGKTIDSLQVSGKVINAFTEQPEKEVIVSLYKSHEDSSFKKQEPYYLTKTGKNGNFSFYFIGYGKYKIYALKDANYSKTFDQPGEKIAFIDSLVIPGVKVKRDSTDSITGHKFYPGNLKLRLFEEEEKQQFVDETKRPKSYYLVLKFKKEQDSSVYWNFPFADTSNIFTDINSDRDSLQFWLRDTSLCKKDSIEFHVQYYSGVDSVGWQKDTVFFSGESDFENEKFEFKSNITGSKLDYWKKPEFYNNTGLKKINDSLIQVFRIINDSTERKIDFDLLNKSDNRFLLDFKLSEGKKYRISMDSAALQDNLYRYNDSTAVEFMVTDESEYSSLELTVPHADSDYFCDLLQNKNIVRRRVFDSKGKINFIHLSPGKYDLRIVEDKNKNKEWDTGNFNKKKQPEKVWYKDKSVELRKNWIQKTEWRILKTKSDSVSTDF